MFEIDSEIFTARRYASAVMLWLYVGLFVCLSLCPSQMVF